MDCVAHAGTSAEESCALCRQARCESCLTYETDGQVTCGDCGALEDERSAALGSALLGFAAVGYLATLAVGYTFFHARPFVGGLAAVVAIAVWRILQTTLSWPSARRRGGASLDGPRRHR